MTKLIKVARRNQTKRVRSSSIGKSVPVVPGAKVAPLATGTAYWEETNRAGANHLTGPKGSWLVGGYNGFSSWAGFSSSDAAFKEGGL